MPAPTYISWGVARACGNLVEPSSLGRTCLCTGVNKGNLPAALPLSLPSPQEIDEYITQARDKSYETMMRVGKRGLNLAANAAVTAAAKVRRGRVHSRVLSRPIGIHPVFRPWRLWVVRLQAPVMFLLLSNQFPRLAKGKISQHYGNLYLHPAPPSCSLGAWW